MRAQRVPAALGALLAALLFTLLGSLAGAPPAVAAIAAVSTAPAPVSEAAPDAATTSRHTVRDDMRHRHTARAVHTVRDDMRYRHDVRAVHTARDDMRYRHDVRHLYGGPLRTTAEEARGARPSPLPPAPGGHPSDATSPQPATHGTVRPASAGDTVRTSARAELPDVRGPPGTAGHRSRPTSAPSRPF
ncbi:hypothetical protein SSP531S_08940 [Streptomyces spongiicola]|uniref:Secreted protein n=1 Tax=Streptomyces spongiicola TaxID=1690221 RepID=A0A388SUT0_9ACTN|nr:hypothetical protein [Streptomyces spongiicola]GBP99499.1 hypothetical protein SSP531S_08940 [Streptomyces spongiicola]